MASRASVKPKKQQPEPVSIEDRIRQRAYEIYLQRDGRERTALDDWLPAETDITHTVERNYAHRGEAAAGGSRE
jgi:hypothetical protein